jgi:MFS family permease
MTTATLALAPAPVAVRAPLISRALLLRFVTIIGSSLGFYLPLSVVPQVAGATGSAGLATGALLVASVAGEVATPRLVARFGYRFALTAGLVLLGAPTLLLLSSSELGVLIAVNLVRGLGFGVTIVAGGALTAALLPADRRGEGLALVGVVGGVPAIVALPFGVWAAGQWGAGTVFAITAVTTLLSLVAVPGLPRRTASAGGAHGTHGVLAGLRDAGLMRPAAVFAASTVAIGVLVTFLPLATGSASVAAAALLVQPATATAARWVAGRLGDRYGQAPLLVPGLVLAGLGLLGVAATGVPAAVVAGAAVFGAGFGVLQNATLALMYTRVTPEGYGTVSAIWNAAYDVGMAVGAAGAGLVAAGAGYPVVFALTAALLLPALLPARRERRAASPSVTA